MRGGWEASEARQGAQPPPREPPNPPPTPPEELEGELEEDLEEELRDAVRRGAGRRGWFGASSAWGPPNWLWSAWGGSGGEGGDAEGGGLRDPADESVGTTDEEVRLAVSA